MPSPPRQNVLAITFHRLTRFIDMYNDLSPAEIIGLKLRTEKDGSINRHYVMLHLQSRAGATMWLRLESIWKSFGEPFLKQGIVGILGLTRHHHLRTLALRLASRLGKIH